MPRANKKKPPVGLGCTPREGALARKEDNLALLRFVRRRLQLHELNLDDPFWASTVVKPDLIKGRQGYPRRRVLPNPHKVPPELVALTRAIHQVLRRHFTPSQRRHWWSAEQMAIMILFDSEEGPPAWDDWIAPLTRLVAHGEEKRRRRLSSGHTR
jgi:hypothetical protein